MQVVARDGDAVLIAEGNIGASVLPSGQTLILPVASLAAHGDWEPASGPVPSYAPKDLAEQIAEFARQWRP